MSLTRRTSAGWLADRHLLGPARRRCVRRCSHGMAPRRRIAVWGEGSAHSCPGESCQNKAAGDEWLSMCRCQCVDVVGIIVLEPNQLQEKASEEVATFFVFFVTLKVFYLYFVVFFFVLCSLFFYFSFEKSSLFSLYCCTYTLVSFYSFHRLVLFFSSSKISN